MAIAPGTFCWHEMATPDVAKAKVFYEALFGWTTEDHPMPGDMPGMYTMLRLDGKDVGGMYPLAGPQAEMMPPNWGGYVASDDIDATAAAAKAAGGNLLYEPMDIPSVGRLVGFTSPEGAVLSAYKEKGRDGVPVAPMTPNAFCWAELLTRDPDTSGSFYTKVFNWKSETMDMPTGPYTVFQAGEAQIAGMMNVPPMVPAEVPSHWLYYIMVTDCAASSAKAKELGATLQMENMAIPTVGTFSVIQDPTGPTFGIIQFEG